MNELAEMIQNRIQEVFESENRILSDDELYTYFQSYEPSEHVIEKEVHYFLNSYYIFEDTKIEWEGDLSGIEISRQISVGLDEEGIASVKTSA
ncbi:hypothetical protein [Rossellomorea aquimaris]|uniref:hypothetical protein n=1 Tax=Rossellomorea aquimaris TaxID=189382 RepID=UPI0011E91FA9|nr:hypothetical protein [Rossellomorea aquimaris]TYS91942.1 hypothetical protein FZC88_07345 [Rossellomorea aquimaris]